MPKLWDQLAIATNWPVLASVGVLSSLGVMSIWADSPAEGQRQLLFVAMGFGILLVIQWVNYQILGRWAWTFYGMSLLLILYTVFPWTHAPRFSKALFRVPETNGAFAWINFPFVTLQPAELMKIGFVSVMARFLRYRSNYRTWTGLVAPFALAGVPLLVILKQPDLGTALVFIPAVFAMLYVAGAKVSHLLILAGIGVAFMPVAWLAGQEDVPVFRHLPPIIKNYQRNRVYVMFSKDPKLQADVGYQQERAMITLGSGGLWGKGAGNIPIGKGVPEAQNDMIFALIGEQFGFIGSAGVLLAYIVLFAAGIEIAGSTKEPFGRYVALGIVTMLAGQTFLNIMVAMRLMPVTGVTLPFVSYGGSSLLASFIAAGLLLNIGQNRPMVIGRKTFSE